MPEDNNMENLDQEWKEEQAKINAIFLDRIDELEKNLKEVINRVG